MGVEGASTAWRKDTLTGDNGDTITAWAWRVPIKQHMLREGMLIVYPLPKEQNERDPQFVAPGMTHEFTAYLLDPTVPVDFSRDLFTQKELSPLTPAVVGFQFQVLGDADPADRFHAFVDQIARGELKLTDAETWTSNFADGVPVQTGDFSGFGLEGVAA